MFLIFTSLLCDKALFFSSVDLKKKNVTYLYFRAKTRRRKIVVKTSVTQVRLFLLLFCSHRSFECLFLACGPGWGGGVMAHQMTQLRLGNGQLELQNRMRQEKLQQQSQGSTILPYPGTDSEGCQQQAQLIEWQKQQQVRPVSFLFSSLFFSRIFAFCRGRETRQGKRMKRVKALARVRWSYPAVLLLSLIKWFFPSAKIKVISGILYSMLIIFCKV